MVMSAIVQDNLYETTLLVPHTDRGDMYDKFWLLVKQELKGKEDDIISKQRIKVFFNIATGPKKSEVKMTQQKVKEKNSWKPGFLL